MKIGSVQLSGVSIAVLAVQLALVSSIAAKYLYERATCPRVWTRTAVYDPDLFMRGRYLALRPTVDACVSGNSLPGPGQPGSLQILARLAVENNKLVAYALRLSTDAPNPQFVTFLPGRSCDRLTLMQPVNFYIAEHAKSPVPVTPGDELWIEVSLPPKGPPRPLQLALKHPDGGWQPLAY